MSKNEFIHIIHRYLTAESTPEERERVEQWIEASPENRETFESIKKIWEIVPEKELRADLGEAWHRLEEKMKESEYNRVRSFHTQKVQFSRNAKKNSRNQIWLRVAALLMIGVLLSLFALWFAENVNTETAGVQEEIAMQEVRTDRAHQSRMTFSDGTEVRLNAASMIRFPRQFDSNIREVWLEGEAWFDVEHNPNVEFVVRTPDATVRVLGTEFNVKAYSGEPDVEVVVAEGLVEVHAAETSDNTLAEVLLQKGEMSRLIRGKGLKHASEVNLENHLSWLKGRFVFNETPFARVLSEWERRFNVDFEVEDDSLLATPFTGEYRYETFDEMLRLASITLAFEYTRENNTIRIISSNKK